MTELKPCPFCGCAELHAFEHSEGEESFGFQCTSCWMTGPQFGTRAEAIAAWNTRARPTPQAGVVGELRAKALTAMAAALKASATSHRGECYAHGFTECPQEGGWSGEVDGEFDLEPLLGAVLAVLLQTQWDAAIERAAVTPAMVEAALQARCTVEGVHWADGLTEGVARIEQMLMEKALQAAIRSPSPEGEGS